MDGKVCVVTGATSGIGGVTLRELARSGATAVIVCRSREKGEEVQRAVRRETGSERVELVLADLASFADIRRAAQEILERWSRLDVLINNAGAINTARSTTVDGIETTFAVNHLAPFLLTTLLLDRLKQSAPSRVVTVSSRAHARTGIDFDDIEAKRSYRGVKVYSQSKLCNVLFTYELARRLAGTGVTANALHPGVIATGFGRNRPGLFNLGVRLLAPFMLTPEEGARASLHLAISAEVEGVTGKYYNPDASEGRSSRASHDRESQRRLWDLSLRMTGQT